MYHPQTESIMTLTEKYRQQIESELERLVRDRRPEGLYAPVSYVLSLGGKRIRPVLCLLGCALYNAERVKDSLYPALGLEVFHNFTLLHDDIMDQSDMRRNRPTVHRKWDNNTAILSGDAMTILAYQLVARGPSESLRAVLELFSRTGLEVCEGQQYDMEFEQSSSVGVKDYLEMIRLKTAVLLGASLQTGALIGGAGDAQAQALYRFGIAAGIAFQLQDDWLDVYGDAATFGKNIGGDIINNKKTFLLLQALESLSPAGRAELQSWISRSDYDREEKIAAVRNLYDQVNVSDTARKLMDSYHQEALAHLQVAGGDSAVANELKDFARGLMERVR